MTSWGQAARFEDDAARDGIGDSDIHFSRLTGMSPADIEQLRILTISESLLVVIRCPKQAARFHQGKYPAKPLMVSAKSGDDGLAVGKNGRVYVSDYDLMCVYRAFGNGQYESIFFSGVDPANKRSRLAPDATLLIRKMNSGLVSKFQHGAQDDFNSPKHPNATSPLVGRFVAFDLGTVHYLPTPDSVRGFYAKRGLNWPYDASGLFKPH